MYDAEEGWVTTHRLTRAEWVNWKSASVTAVGDEGLVADPPLSDLLPAATDGTQDYESWEKYKCDTVTSYQIICDAWMKKQENRSQGYPIYKDLFEGEAAFVRAGATVNASKREFIQFTFDGATSVSIAATSLLLVQGVLQFF
jgi:hypothetical protein